MYGDAESRDVSPWIVQYGRTSVWTLRTLVCHCLGAKFDDLTPIIVV